MRDVWSGEHFKVVGLTALWGGTNLAMGFRLSPEMSQATAWALGYLIEVIVTFVLLLFWTRKMSGQLPKRIFPGTVLMIGWIVLVYAGKDLAQSYYPLPVLERGIALNVSSAIVDRHFEIRDQIRDIFSYLLWFGMISYVIALFFVQAKEKRRGKPA